ncbi:MAG: GerMN domain-containing protein, partial [Armatimonadota bacterium]|nr:GerMN domain-containing protein [Armatimonadota bacterium]
MKKGLLPAAVCAAMLVAAGCHHDNPPVTPPVTPSPPVASTPTPRDKAIVYVINPKATDDQDELMPRTVLLHHSASPVRDAITALLNAKGSPLPSGIALRGITIDNG